ncbi:hypothetical protein L6164_026585 [Bauhinia variegata]|uniref:Uncharacterized protein n=1 Tax=Bauhinia variegata TaxID=167791 RepID=A0ACB9LQ83_BAUVA|nr:hypothetical protein L6164_026585 [Bauhinia variegata]
METADFTKLIPSLKELAKKKFSTVPDQYVCSDQDPPIQSNTTSLPQVPVIDLSKLLSEDANGPELEKLDLACKEWGFFQLINHGVNIELVENVKRGAHELFDLTMEEKKKLWQKPGDMEGFGQMQLQVSENKQQLEWVDRFYIFTLPKHLRKPHLFPNIPLPFRDHLETYCVEMRQLAIKVIDLIAKALGMDSKDIKDSFGIGGQSMRINYYPPCPQPEHVIGLKAHTDNSTLTILLQVDETEGLEIKKDGMWVPAKPLPNAFVISIGDVMEIITNGMYQSTEHRATVNSQKERISIATFYGPEWDGSIGPAASIVTPQTPPLFKTVSVADYYTGFLSGQYPKKSYIDLMRIQNNNDGGS